MDFDDMDKQMLRNYVDFLMRQFRLVDAFWYIYVDEEQGSDKANHFNERVWSKVAGLGARDIVKYFHIKEKGLTGFVQAMRFFPWCRIVGYEIDEQPDEVTISVPDCPTQTARLTRGLGEYDCKEMHRAEFITFANEIDPGIKVECIHAPPDPHPDERICMWKFTMG